MVIFDDSMVAYRKRFSNNASLRLEYDYLENRPIALISSFKNLYHNSSLGLDLRLNDGVSGESLLEILHSGEEVEYEVIQLIN